MRERTIGNILLAAVFFLLLWGIGLTTKVFASVVEVPLHSRETLGPGNGKVAFGIDYSDVFDRQLDSSGSAPTSAKSGRITKSNQIHAKVIYAVNQYLNIYGKVGGSSWGDKFLLNNGGKVEVDYSTAFSWGIGASGGRRFVENWQVFYDLQFLSTPSADVTNVRISGRTNNNKEGSVSVDEFHLALGMGREFHTYYDWASIIFPYIGVIFSTLSIDHNSVTSSSGTFNDTMDTDKNFGIFAGIRFANESNWTLRLEGRVGDESSVSVSLDYLF